MYAIEVGEYNDIVSWSKDGTSFVVKDPHLFTSRVVQVLFQMAKFDSFTRKLGRWGFAKKRDTEKKKVLFGGRLVSLPTPTLFCHPAFQRGDFELCRTSVVCNSKVDIEACTLLLASAQKQWQECHREEERRKLNDNARDQNLVNSGIPRGGGHAAVGTSCTSSSAAGTNGTAAGINMNFAATKMSSSPASSPRGAEVRGGRRGPSTLQSPNRYQPQPGSPNSIVSSSAEAPLTTSSNVTNVLDAVAAAGRGLPARTDMMRVASLLSNDTTFLNRMKNEGSGFDLPRNSAGPTTSPRRTGTDHMLDRRLHGGHDVEGRYPADMTNQARSLLLRNQEVAGSSTSTHQQQNHQYTPAASTLLEGFHSELTVLQRQVQQPFGCNEDVLNSLMASQQQQQYQQLASLHQEDRTISNDPNLMALMIQQQNQELQRLRDGISSYALESRGQSHGQDGSGLRGYHPQEMNQSSATTRNHHQAGRQEQEQEQMNQLHYALMQNRQQANNQNGGYRHF